MVRLSGFYPQQKNPFITIYQILPSTGTNPTLHGCCRPNAHQLRRNWERNELPTNTEDSVVVLEKGQELLVHLAIANALCCVVYSFRTPRNKALWLAV